MALPTFPIPGIAYFVNRNTFCGSHRGLNYTIKPIPADKEQGAPACLHTVIWYGEQCSACSEEKGNADFPLDADGLAATVNWLWEQDALYREQAEENE